MIDAVRIVNAHWQMKTMHRINILELFQILKLYSDDNRLAHSSVKHYSGRPNMTRWKMNGVTILFFTGGAIQVIGKEATLSLALKIRQIIKWIFKTKMKIAVAVNISQPVLQNMVVTCKYLKPFYLTGRSSSSLYFYETELFPAALIRYWAPAHVALFPSGSLVCTGIKTWRSFYSIIRSLSHYLDGRDDGDSVVES